MKAPTLPRSIVGRYELQEIFGVTRQGTAGIVEHADFPPPICFVGKSRSPLFYRKDVERFKFERDAERARAAA